MIVMIVLLSWPFFVRLTVLADLPGPFYVVTHNDLILIGISECQIRLDYVTATKLNEVPSHFSNTSIIVPFDLCSFLKGEGKRTEADEMMIIPLEE